MADIAVTASTVLAVSGANTSSGTAGEALTAGEPLYKDTADSNKLKAAKADAEATAVFEGIALHAAASGQPVAYIKSGDMTMTTAPAMTVGQIYVISANAAGAIAPIGDLASTEYPSILGVATSGTALTLNPWTTGVAKA